MTDAQFYKKFMQVLDKGIALYTEALNTERGDSRGWLIENHMDSGLCLFFSVAYLYEVKWWIEDALGEIAYVCPRGLNVHRPRHERFARRLQILQQIKKELE